MSVKQAELLQLLNAKRATIKMCGESGYDVKSDDAFFSYSPEDLEPYCEHLRPQQETNPIFTNGAPYNIRTCLSTFYESKSRKGFFCVVYFLPQKNTEGPKARKIILNSPIDLVSKYGYHNPVYCSDCVIRINSTKQCIKCPPQKHCTKCKLSLSCRNCLPNSFCSKCANKLRKFKQYRFTLDFCENCEDGKYCDACDDVRKSKECKNCTSYKIRHSMKVSRKSKVNDFCIECIKCENCTDELCEDCSTKYNFTPCVNCPLKKFCYDCNAERKIDSFCDNCPVQTDIIERCIIVSASELTPDSKKTATVNMPKVNASTGEWIENGCVVQVYLDRDLSYNPLLHDMGNRYYPLSTEESVAFFRANKNVTENQMPRMDAFGPICKYLGLYPGKLVRIERNAVIPNSSDECTVSYRLVVGVSNVKKSRVKVKKVRQVAVQSDISNEEV